MRLSFDSAWLLCALALLSACAPTPAAVDRRAQSEDELRTAQASKTLTIIGRNQPVNLAVPGLRATGAGVSGSVGPFNAALDTQDARENNVPQLAEALPQLNTDTWRLLPDGRMQTRYTLKPNLTWHDGTPLTAEDFVFAFNLYSIPELGAGGGSALRTGASATAVRADMEMSAPDSRTIFVDWKRPRPEAGALEYVGAALPRHILEEPLRTLSADAFVAHPYWTLEFVGLGPYRLARWEPGAFLEGTAFDGYVWGSPRIGRIRVQWTLDENVALANLLGSNVNYVTDLALRFEQAAVLNRTWAPTNGGTTIGSPTSARFLWIQQRPDVATPRSLTDLRVRRALAHSVDRQALNEGLFEGAGLMTDTMVRPTEPWFAETERLKTTYPFDLRRTEQLMVEAGYRRGPDEVFADAAGERFDPEIMNQPGAQPERETAIMREIWKRGGIDSHLELELSANTQRRAMFPSLQAGGGMVQVGSLVSTAIGTPANRFAGSNRSGWSNPDFDALYARWSVTLDSEEHNRLEAQMRKIQTEQLPGVGLFFNLQIAAWLAALQGPDAGTTSVPNLVWNIHEWTLA